MPVEAPLGTAALNRPGLDTEDGSVGEEEVRVKGEK